MLLSKAPIQLLRQLHNLFNRESRTTHFAKPMYALETPRWWLHDLLLVAHPLLATSCTAGRVLKCVPQARSLNIAANGTCV